MDADDASHPECLAEQARLFEARPEIGVVGCLGAFGGDRSVGGGFARHVDWLNTLITPEQIALNRFIESPFAHPSVRFRREVVRSCGAYRNGDFPEDCELWRRWAAAGGRMGKVPRVLLTCSDSPGRLSRTDPQYAVEAFYRMKAEYIARELARLRHPLPSGVSATIPPGRPVFIWGAGRPTRKRAGYLDAHGMAIAGHIDIDARKIGRRITGRPVIAADALPPPGAAFVLGHVASRGARELIRGRLAARGYVEGVDFLMCA